MKDSTKKNNWYVPSLSEGNQKLNIPSVTLNEPGNYIYSNLSNVDIVKRQNYSMQMVGDKLLNLSIEKLIIHEAIINISLNYQMKSEESFQDICNKLTNIAKTTINQEIYQSQLAENVNKAKLETQNLISLFISNSGDTKIEKLNEWMHKLESIPENKDLTKEQKIKILADSLFDQILIDKNEKTIQGIVNESVHMAEFKQEVQGISKITFYKDVERKSILVVGGAASGKGSVTALTKNIILNNDATEINPDLYKKLILSEDNIDNQYDKEQTKLNHGSITHAESSLIFDKIAARWQKLAEQGQAPNILIDVCRASNWIIDIASTGKTKVEIHAATLDTETALERSYKRGEDTGRFMPTKGLIQGHKDQINTQTNAINNLNCDLILYSTAGNFGDPPSPVLIAMNDEKRINIFDIKPALDFFKKQNLNPDAENKESLYSENSAKSIVKSLKEYSKNMTPCFYNKEQKQIAMIDKEGNLVIDKEVSVNEFKEFDNNNALQTIIKGIKENGGKIKTENKYLKPLLNLKYNSNFNMAHNNLNIVNSAIKINDKERQR